MNWTTVPIYRGITEITPLLDLIEDIEGVYILGGYARYCASPRDNPHPAQDIDLFFRDQETYDDVFKKLYRKGFQSKNENDQANTLRYKYKEDVDEIRFLYYEKGLTQKEISMQYPVTRSHISHIVRGESWDES